jgi:two-component system sensor histidine kinase KdpD
VYPSARSKLTGLLVAAVSVAAITAVIFPLRHVVPAVSTGVLYLLGVLLVSTYWGLALGLVTSLASAAAFNFFHIPPTGHFSIAHTENWVALGVYFVAAVVTSTLATAARARAVEADSRRREADLAAELARVVLGAPELDRALPEAAARIGDTVGADGVRLELGWVDGTDDEQAIPLVDDGRRVGTLLVPRDAPAQLRDRLERRVVPPLTALLTAAVRRTLLEEEAVEAKAFRRRPCPCSRRSNSAPPRTACPSTRGSSVAATDSEKTLSLPGPPGFPLPRAGRGTRGKDARNRRPRTPAIRAGSGEPEPAGVPVSPHA